MPQHDKVIADQLTPAFRADLNNALLSEATLNSGPGAPSPTYQYQLWADTGTNRLRQRNANNTGWIEIGRLDTLQWGIGPNAQAILSIEGLAVSVSAATITVQPGRATIVRAGGDRVAVTLTNPINKILSSVWAAGNNAGGRAAATSWLPNTWYHVFLLVDSTGNNLDVYADTSVTAANRPGGWDARMIMSVLTSPSSALVPYAQFGDRIDWNSPVVDFTTLGLSTSTAHNITIAAPAGLICEAYGWVERSSAIGLFFNQTDVTTLSYIPPASPASIRLPYRMKAINRQLRMYAASSGLAAEVLTLGYIHPRGMIY